MAKGSGVKTNEAPARAVKTGQRGPAGVGVRAEAKYIRTSAYKVREVLDLIRGHDVVEAANILRFCQRDAAITIAKVLRSAIANAGHNDDIPMEELYVSACYADEGPTIKRFRPRARGRTGRINKRTSHITVLVSRKPESLLNLARQASAAATADRARRTAGSRAAAEQAITESRREETGIEETVAGATLVDAASATPAPTPDSEGRDPLNQIVGIGPKIQDQLYAAGITTFRQVADLTDDEISALDESLASTGDEIKNWRQQAGEILAGTWVDTSTNNT